jgi:hypothetical protein
MERKLCIFEMSDTASPTSLAHLGLLQERLLKEYAAARARRAISLKVVPHSNDDLWSFVMLPDASGEHSFSFPFGFLFRIFYSSSQSLPAAGDRAHRPIRPVDALISGRRLRRAAAVAGGPSEGEEDQVARTPRAVQ